MSYATYGRYLPTPCSELSLVTKCDILRIGTSMIDESSKKATMKDWSNYFEGNLKNARKKNKCKIHYQKLKGPIFFRKPQKSKKKQLQNLFPKIEGERFFLMGPIHILGTHTQLSHLYLRIFAFSKYYLLSLSASFRFRRIVSLSEPPTGLLYTPLPVSPGPAGYFWLCLLGRKDPSACWVSD